VAPIPQPIPEPAPMSLDRVVDPQPAQQQYIYTLADIDVFDSSFAFNEANYTLNEAEIEAIANSTHDFWERFPGQSGIVLNPSINDLDNGRYALSWLPS